MAALIKQSSYKAPYIQELRYFDSKTHVKLEYTAGLCMTSEKNPQQYNKKWDQDTTCQCYKELGTKEATLRKLKIFLTMQPGFLPFSIKLI